MNGRNALRGEYYLTHRSPIIAAIALAIIVLSGCLAPSGQPGKGAAKDTANFSASAKDDAGRVISVNKKPERLISLAPANTEILFALGLGKKVVGVSTYCDYPPEASKREKVGDFVNPNLEKIIALRPDLVFATGGVQKPVIKRLDDSGIKVFVVDPKSVSGILDVIVRIGKITGSEEKASALVNGLRKRVDAVKRRAANSKTKPKVFYEVYSQPLMTAGGTSVVNDVITIAGGVNIAGDIKEDFPQYSLETLIEKNPDIYIATTGSMQNPGEIKKRPGWEKINAVKNDRVFILDDNLMSRYGPRLIDGLEQVARAINQYKNSSAG